MPHALLNALEASFALVDPTINALPARCFDRVRTHADRLMQVLTVECGALTGLALPIEELIDVAGVRSTQGSTIFAQHIPQ